MPFLISESFGKRTEVRGVGGSTKSSVRFASQAWLALYVGLAGWRAVGALCVHRAMLFAQPDEYSVHQAGLKNNFIQQVILPARLPAELKPWVRRRLLRATLDLRKA